MRSFSKTAIACGVVLGAISLGCAQAEPCPSPALGCNPPDTIVCNPPSKCSAVVNPDGSCTRDCGNNFNLKFVIDGVPGAKVMELIRADRAKNSSSPQ
jgi:hypothetical protein